MSIVKDSQECSVSSLEWFSTLPTQTAIEKSSDVQYRPLGAKNDEIVEFFIPATTDEYFDMQHSRLYIKAKIVHLDGTDIGPNENVAPINDLLNGLWKNVDLELNNRNVTQGNTNHGYISMISHLIHDSEESLKSERSMRLLYKDTPNQMDVVNARVVNNENVIPGFDFGMNDDELVIFAADEVVGNNGLHKRYRETHSSKEFELIGGLNIDVCHQERYWPNGIEMKLRLHRQNRKFTLMSAADEFKIEIRDIYLLMRKAKPSPGVLLGHADGMLKMPAKFPITRRQCKAYSLAEGLRDVQHDNLVLGQLPKRVVVAMVDADAFSGTNTKNPYNFKHNNVTHVQLLVDGEPVRTQAIQPNIAAGSYLPAYETLYRGLNNMDGDRGTIIKRVDWDKGYSLFAFDLTADMDSDDRYSLIKHGNLRLEMKFAEALDRAVNILVYLEFTNTIEVTSDRHVSIDYV